MKIMLIPALIVLIASCNKEVYVSIYNEDITPKKGTWVYFIPEDSVTVINNYRNYHPVGTSIIIYNDSTILVSTFKNGELDGWSYRYVHGQKYKVAKYKNGLIFESYAPRF